MAKENKTLNKIGTDEDKILKIRVVAREKSAKARLALLETGKHDYPYHSEKMLAELKDAKIAPEKIGATKEKLHELKILWAKNRIAGFIRSVELGGNKDYHLGLINEFLKANELNLCHVDSTEDNIRQLLNEAHRYCEAEQAQVELATKKAKDKGEEAAATTAVSGQ